jgi:hypothetical protein
MGMPVPQNAGALPFFIRLSLTPRKFSADSVPKVRFCDATFDDAKQQAFTQGNLPSSARIQRIRLYELADSAG